MSTSDSHPLPSDRMAVLRILDANQNRASEGLRVVEEYARFVLDDSQIAGLYKQLRHDLAAALAQIPHSDQLQARDTARDVGTRLTTSAEYRREELQDVVHANLKRVEQSLRALEEYGKVLSPEMGQSIEALRYRAYGAAKMLGLATNRRQELATAQLYVLIDGRADLDTFANDARAIVAAGAQVVQLRDKRLNDRQLLERARRLRQLTRGQALFIMNDRPDLAVLSDADGVHVGQEELSVKDARTMLGPRRLVGVSTHSLAQARAAVEDGADYIGCGPTFASATKTFTQFPGIALLQAVARETGLPAFAIGGITLANLGEVLAAGFQRVAVSGAVLQANDPAAAVRELRAKLAAVTPAAPASGG